VCGPLRPGADGLRLAPGPVPARTGATACTWVPGDSLGAGSGQRLPPEFAWAAMDCPGGWTADLARTPMVLNRFAVDLTDAPQVGARYVIVGEQDRQDGHTMTTTTALYAHDGTIVGRSLARWTRIAPESLSQ
jgi:hypothetical protein